MPQVRGVPSSRTPRTRTREGRCAHHELASESARSDLRRGRGRGGDGQRLRRRVERPPQQRVGWWDHRLVERRRNQRECRNGRIRPLDRRAQQLPERHEPVVPHGRQRVPARLERVLGVPRAAIGRRLEDRADARGELDDLVRPEDVHLPAATRRQVQRRHPVDDRRRRHVPAQRVHELRQSDRVPLQEGGIAQGDRPADGADQAAPALVVPARRSVRIQRRDPAPVLDQAGGLQEVPRRSDRDRALQDHGHLARHLDNDGAEPELLGCRTFSR
jgi:hypothetical protein